VGLFAGTGIFFGLILGVLAGVPDESQYKSDLAAIERRDDAIHQKERLDAWKRQVEPLLVKNQKY